MVQTGHIQGLAGPQEVAESYLSSDPGNNLHQLSVVVVPGQVEWQFVSLNPG